MKGLKASLPTLRLNQENEELPVKAEVHVQIEYRKEQTTTRKNDTHTPRGRQMAACHSHDQKKKDQEDCPV